MITKIELIIIKYFIKFIRLISKNCRINKLQKDNFISIVEKNNFSIEDFIWKSVVINFKIYTSLNYKKYGYYFIFNNNNYEYDYFPSWTDEKFFNKKQVDDEFMKWLHSINRVLNRSKQINISISDGSKLRKEFPNLASLIKNDE